MKHLILYLILISSSILLIGCGKSLKTADYFNWNNQPNSPLIKNNLGKYYTISATFRPIDFMALSQLNGEEITEKKMNDTKSGLTCCRHFKINIQAKDSSDVLTYKLRSKDEYYERIKYLSNDISNHLYLIDGKDTLSCTFSHYERTYKMKSSATVMAFFERKKSNLPENIPMKLLLTTGGFNPNTLEFKFNETELNNIPQLIY
jgi:hypothetical protein